MYTTCPQCGTILLDQEAESHQCALAAVPVHSNVPKVGVGGPGTNTGHGHVWPRPDGTRMRCGGPTICRTCASDFAWYTLSQQALK